MPANGWCVLRISQITTGRLIGSWTLDVLPDESYGASADYHWGSINANAQVYPVRADYELGDGPFGFRSSVQLPGAMVSGPGTFFRCVFV